MTFESLGIKTKQNAGVRYSTPCPHCGPHRKPQNRNKECLTVNDEPGNRWYNCNHPGCGFSGNLDIKEKYSEVYKAARIPAQRPSIFSKEVSDWAASRGLQTAVLLGKCQAYEVDGKNGHKELAFPFIYRHEIVNVKFRRIFYDEATEGKVYQIPKQKGTLTCFLGLHLINFTEQTPDVLIVEGEPDWVTWLQCSIGTIGDNVLSVPMGAPAPSQKNLDTKLDFLKDKYSIDLLSKARRIYIGMDNDEAGKNFKEILVERLGKQRCYILNYPPGGYKDSNEVYNGDAKKGLDPLGKDGIERLYNDATPYPLRGIITVWDVEEEIDHTAEKGFEQGYTTKTDVDRYISLRKDLTVAVTGIPNHGKSTWLRWYLSKQCENNPFMKWALHTPEARPRREFAKIGEVYMSKPFFKHSPNAMNEAERAKAKRWTAEHFKIINPDKKMFELFDPKYRIKGLKNILSYVKHLKMTEGIFGYTIDPWNKLEHEQPANMNETTFISRQLDIITEFNEVYGLCGIIVAHPTKIDTIRGGNFRIPTLYDISGSANWFNKIDIGITVYRKDFKKASNKKNEDGDEVWEEDGEAPSQIIISKMRHEELGRKGRIEMHLDKRNGNSFVTKRPPVYTNDSVSSPSPGGDTNDDLPF